MAEEILCSICVEPIKDKAQIEGCKHNFCFECIHKWSESRCVCPVCNQQFSVLNCKFKDDCPSEQLPVSVKPKTVDDGPPDLGGLDHEYFRNETARLVAATEAAIAKLTLTKQQSMFGRTLGSTWEQDNLETLQTVHAQLSSLSETFATGRQFDPLSAMEDLLRLEDTVRRVREDPLNAAAGGSRPRVVGADDWEDDEDWDDDEFDQPGDFRVGGSGTRLKERRR